MKLYEIRNEMPGYETVSKTILTIDKVNYKNCRQ